MGEEPKVRAREWLIEENGRVFPLVDGKFYIEYSGFPPKRPIHVIEKVVFDNLQNKFNLLRRYHWGDGSITREQVMEALGKP